MAATEMLTAMAPPPAGSEGPCLEKESGCPELGQRLQQPTSHKCQLGATHRQPAIVCPRLPGLIGRQAGIF